MGRTTRNGIHQIDGIPVARTEMSRDPKTPVTESDLLKILAAQSRRRAHLVSEQELERLRDMGAAWRRRGVELLVFDAERDEHLEKIAVASPAAGSAFSGLDLPVWPDGCRRPFPWPGEVRVPEPGSGRHPGRPTGRWLWPGACRRSRSDKSPVWWRTGRVRPLVLDRSVILDPAEWEARRDSLCRRNEPGVFGGKGCGDHPELGKKDG